jgi:8-oxo-dGTP pyrophosphatase MutT (NUDIX family)
MYKVFYNQRTVFFIDKNKNCIDQSDSSIHLFKDKQQLSEELNSFQNNSQLNKLYIIHEDIAFAFKEFSKLYQIIEAAGGLVRNIKNDILVIFRRNIWDLPKGKIEKNESPDIAAVREVEEECGITNIKIGKLLETTYHTYKMCDQYILKKTYWYEMFCKENQLPQPQIEEEITKAEWVSKNNLSVVIKNTFPSIIEVLKKGGLI